MASIQNGNRESPPQLDEGVMKVVVIGEPRCGKTSFIRGYYDRHLPGEMYSHNGVRVYPSCFPTINTLRKVSIFEIPGDPDFFLEQRIPHYEEADIIVFMYAIDDPSSLQTLTEKWILETIGIIISYGIPVVFVGTKKDLRDNQQVIERLAVENKIPVSLQQARETIEDIAINPVIIECSSFHLDEVHDTFNTIFAIGLVNE